MGPELLRPDVDEKRQHIERAVREMLDQHCADGELAGFCFMIWDTDCKSTATSANMGGHIPSVVIPDFVRNRLLQQRIEDWAVARLTGE